MIHIASLLGILIGIIGMIFLEALGDPEKLTAPQKQFLYLLTLLFIPILILFAKINTSS